MLLTLASNVAAGAALLADDGDDDKLKAGPIGLFVIVILCVACYFLYRSMSRHLKKVRTTYGIDDSPVVPNPDQPTPDDAPPESAAAVVELKPKPLQHERYHR